MDLTFAKYQATGNDFILLDNRRKAFRLSVTQIRQLCHRKFGIGGDGIILIEPHQEADFYMNYFNADGSQSLCGNGSRAAVHYARQLGCAGTSATFAACDGLHLAYILADGQISIQMHPVKQIIPQGEDVFVHTGSPHLIRWVKDVENYPVLEEGRKLRYSQPYASQGGTNVNFVELLGGNQLKVRTYERGVEDETLSCGTGATAAALAAALHHGYTSPVHILTRGGQLRIEFSFHPEERSFYNIFLTGPVEKVFDGRLNLPATMPDN